MKRYLLFAALAFLAGNTLQSNFGAPPAGGTIGGTVSPLPGPGSSSTTVPSTIPGAPGTATTPGSLGTPGTAGTLGTPATPGNLGTPTTPGSLGTAATPGNLGSLVPSVTPGDLFGIPIPVNPAFTLPGPLGPAPGLGTPGSLGTSTGSSTGLVISPALPGSTVVPGTLPSLGQGLMQSEADRDLSAAIRSSLQNNSGLGATPNPAIGPAGTQGAGTLSSGALQSVQINSRGGSVTLRGMVPTEADRRAIESQVLLTPGVHSINNQLTVSPDASRTPSSSAPPPRP